MKKAFLLLALLALLPIVAEAQTCTSGASGVAPIVKLTFTAPTTNTDGTAIATPVTYNIYQSATPGTEVKVASGVTGSPATVTIGLLPGATAYFKVSVVDKNGAESALSNEACKTFPGSVPGTVVITIT